MASCPTVDVCHSVPPTRATVTTVAVGRCQTVGAHPPARRIPATVENATVTCRIVDAHRDVRPTHAAARIARDSDRHVGAMRDARPTSVTAFICVKGSIRIAVVTHASKTVNCANVASAAARLVRLWNAIPRRAVTVMCVSVLSFAQPKAARARRNASHAPVALTADSPIAIRGLAQSWKETVLVTMTGATASIALG